MTKTIKWVLALLLIAALGFGALPSASAELSGTCGEDAFWVLDDDGTLTISGSGMIWNPDIGVDRLTGLVTSVVIENGITEIAEATFGGYTKLESVELPDTLTVIGEYAFGQCISLCSIELPESLERIDRVAFMGCTSLDTLTVPRNVSSIGQRICNTTAIEMDAENPYFSSENGILFNKNKTALLLYPERGNTAYAVPNGVTTIGASAFGSCASLETLTLPESLTKVEMQAFAQAGLKEVVFFGAKPSINSNAFQNVLADVFIPSDKNWSSTSQYGGRLTWHRVDRPEFQIQPESQIVPSGRAASFCVTAVGTELSYQWQVLVQNSVWADVTEPDCEGAQTAALTVPVTEERDGSQYRCLISNRMDTRTSETTTLTVMRKPEITEQPTAATAIDGTSATMSVTANGIALSYQWQRMTPNSDAWENVTDTTYSGIQTDTLTIPARVSQDGDRYRCMVTNEAGTVYSNGAILTVIIARPTITTQPVSVTMTDGATTTMFVTAYGGNLSYQWQVRMKDSQSWYNVNANVYSGSLTATLTIPAKLSRNGLQFRCMVMNEAGTVYSNTATLTVFGKPTITAQPASVTADDGATVTMSVTASGANLSYQWQVRTKDSQTWYNVNANVYSGGQTATLTIPAKLSRSGLRFRCKVMNEAGTVYSSGATLTVTAAKPTITRQPASVTAADGATTTMSVAASGTNLSYQWQVRTKDSQTWYNVNANVYSGGQTATLTIPAKLSRDGLRFRCKVMNEAGTVYSSGATLTVFGKPTITAQPASVTADDGATVTMSVTASGANLSYQWQVRTKDSQTWYNVNANVYSGGQTATLTIPAKLSRDGLRFRCKVMNEAGTVYSSGATLTVVP